MSNAKNRLSIYAGPPLRAFLERRPLRVSVNSLAEAPERTEEQIQMDGDAGWPERISESVAINRLCERYHHLLEQSWPDLSERTWEALLNAGNGQTEHKLHGLGWMSPFAMVAEHFGLDLDGVETEADLDERLERAEVSSGVEFRKLRRLDPVQAMAVIEAIERFWGRDPEEYPPSLREGPVDGVFLRRLVCGPEEGARARGPVPVS